MKNEQNTAAALERDPAALVDETPIYEEIRNVSRLAEIQRLAAENGNSDLQSVARCEQNTLVFRDLRTFEAYAHAMGQFFVADDVPYLRKRAQATPNQKARARYLHAIAAITNHTADRAAAAQGYLDAFRHYRLQPKGENPEAFVALRDLIPMAKVVCRRYKLIDAFKAEALAFLLDDNSRFTHLKAELFRAIMDDAKGFASDDLRQLRTFSLEILHASRGGDENDIIATGQAGRKLADRLGESYEAWYRAEAKALEDRMRLEPSPMRTEIVGTRLLRLYQLLRDDAARHRVIAQMREARVGMKYITFSSQPDNWEKHVEYFRTEAQRLVNEYGAQATLLWLATTHELMPSVERINEALKAMHDKGVGLFSQLATRIVSADERMLSQTAPGENAARDFDDQYGIYWTFGSVLPFSIFMDELVPPDEMRLEQIEQFFNESWVGRDEDVSYGGDIKKPNDLVPLLLSGIRLYFKLLKGEEPADAIIPATDTLVLRIEAVLRKLARLLGVPTIKATDGGARPMAEYAGLELLDNEKIAAVCGTDLIIFAKFTLDRRPEGLRNRIGHAILHFGQYDMMNLDAVVFLLLRLAAVAIDQSGGSKSAGEATENANV